jgi:uncharacterized membrane protein (UPF0136 family)
MGYVKKRSLPSVVGGVTFGGLLLGSGVLITRGESYQGHALASSVTGMLSIAMARRYVSAGYKFMPAGLVASIGMIGFAYNAKKAIEWMPDSKSD